MLKFFRNYYKLFLVLILSFWAVAPILKPGFFPIHDDTQVARVFEMAKALSDGQLPVRWVADLGYGFGYPIFNFYSPLPYYFGAVFVLMGLDALLATKIMFIVGILASGLLMYLLTREFWGEDGAIVSGLFYVYAPYHAVDIYVRGAIGEFWALAFLPLAFWGLYKTIKERKTAWLIVGALGFAATILSHNITAIILTPTLILAAILLASLQAMEDKSKLLSGIILGLLMVFLGLGLSAFFWLPAIFEAKFVDIVSLIKGTNDYRLHFLCPWQLLNSVWGYGGSVPSCLADGMSFKIGKLHILMVIASLIPLVIFWTKSKFISRLIFFTIGFFLLATFMTLEMSKPFWQLFPFLSYVQYPWRFLVFIIFSASFLAGATAIVFKKGFLSFASLLISILLFYNVKYFQPETFLNLKASDYLSEEALKWKVSKLSDEYLPVNFLKPKSLSEIAKDKVKLEDSLRVTWLTKRSNTYEFRIFQEREQDLEVLIAYFPGWQIFLDGRPASFKIRQGRIVLTIPPGEHRVKLFFANTLVRNFANLISLFSLFILAGGFVYAEKKKKT